MSFIIIIIILCYQLQSHNTLRNGEASSSSWPFILFPQLPLPHSIPLCSFYNYPNHRMIPLHPFANWSLSLFLSLPPLYHILLQSPSRGSGSNGNFDSYSGARGRSRVSDFDDLDEQIAAALTSFEEELTSEEK